MCATGNIDQMLRYDSDFAIMDNDCVPGFNTSVFLLKTARPNLRANFSHAIPKEYAGDQDWVVIRAPDGALARYVVRTVSAKSRTKAPRHNKGRSFFRASQS